MNRVIAVGHSMGGMVVCDLASRRELAGAILIGAVNPNPQAAEIFAKRINTVRQGKRPLSRRCCQPPS